jgi:hypothetical protein
VTGHTYEHVYTDPVATTAPSSSSSLPDSLAASVAESAKFNPRPLAVVISTAGGGALPLPPRATTKMPSSPSRTSEAAGCPGRPPTGGAIAASTPSSGCLHRRSGTSGSSAGIFPTITVRGDCRKTTCCPRRHPRILWPRASPLRGVPSCSSDPRRSSRPAPRHGSTTRRIPLSPLLHCCPWRGCRDDDCRSSSSNAMPPHKSFLMKDASLS